MLVTRLYPIYIVTLMVQVSDYEYVLDHLTRSGALKERDAKEQAVGIARSLEIIAATGKQATTTQVWFLLAGASRAQVLDVVGALWATRALDFNATRFLDANGEGREQMKEMEIDPANT